MPRVTFVKKARKDNPAVKKGESYFWWKFMVGGRGGPKNYSKTRPRPSQLTQSEFLGGVYSHQEAVEALSSGTGDDIDSLADEIRSVAEEVRALGEEQNEKFYNMPDSLQEGDTGQLLQTRGEQSEGIADELEAAADEIETAFSEIEDMQSEWDELDSKTKPPDDLSEFSEEGDKDLDEDALAEELKCRWNDDRTSKMEHIESDISDRRDEARVSAEGVSWDVE